MKNYGVEVVMENPLVSVKINTYNGYKTVLLPLLSCLNQDYQNIELIVVDDASTDETTKVIEEFLCKYSRRFARVEFIPLRENVGTVKAFNLGLKKCNGRFVKGLGNDDLLYSRTTISDIVKEFDSTKAWAIVGLLKSYSIVNGEFLLHDFQAPSPYEFKYFTLSPQKIALLQMKFGFFISGAATFFSRELIERFEYELLEKIEVKYCEDLMSILWGLENIPINLYKRYVVWYGYGTGITTQKDSPFRIQTAKDHKNFFHWLKNNYTQKNVNNAIKKKVDNLEKNKLYRLSHYPYYSISTKVHQIKKKIYFNRSEVFNSRLAFEQGNGFQNTLIEFYYGKKDIIYDSTDKQVEK